MFAINKNDIIFAFINDNNMKRKYTKTEIGILADVFNKSLLTIQRWIKKSDDKLTSQKALNALKK